MPIPSDRDGLVALIHDRWSKLRRDLDGVDASTAAQIRVTDDGWSIHDLLAVRARWTEMVVEWIEAGRRGEEPETPAPGYGWRETPRLNADIVAAAKSEPFADVVKRLERGVAHALETIDVLDEDELFEAGMFAWAGTNWPVARWLSVNTARQYETARSAIRRSLRG